MKIIITGSLGNISKPLAEKLIATGHAVTIITSKAERQQEIEALGATAAVGSVEDASFLKTAFNGADAVYGMTPPNFAAPNTIKYYAEIADAYFHAVKNAGVKHIVYLSSYGADLESGSGVIRGSHIAEEILCKLTDFAVTFLRPGYFYTNLYNFIGMIKGQGVIGANFGGDDKLVMVSHLDIAAAAAEELTNLTPQNKIRYIASDERTCNEVAKLIGEAIGKPDLQWLTYTDEQVAKRRLEHGIAPDMVQLLVELGAAIHTGLLRSDYEKHRPALAEVKVEEFIKEFARAYYKN